jgi:hypothetical protein
MGQRFAESENAALLTQQLFFPMWGFGAHAKAAWGFGPAPQSEINTVGFAASGITSDGRSRSSLSSSCFLGVVGGFGRENLAAHCCSNLL